MRGHRRGGAHLYYRNPAGEERTQCLRRQAWALGVAASCGVLRSALREEQCLARGGDACEYFLTWAEEPRLAAPALVGLVAAGTLLATPLAAARPIAWVLLPATMLIAYMLEHRRVASTRVPASEQSGSVFRVLVARTLAERPALAMSGRSSEAPEPPAVSREAASAITLEHEGDFWRIGYEGTSVLLRHSRGLALLAQLVRNPGQEIHVSTLDAITPSGGSAVARTAPAPEGGVPPSPGDAGEILDTRARSEYRRRVAELREELEEAREHNDLGRVETLREELQLLEDELRAAVGRGRRPRRAARDAERLRVAITHRIRRTIAQIARHHPALGAHLTAHVSTGYHCVYRAEETSEDE